MFTDNIKLINQSNITEIKAECSQWCNDYFNCPANCEWYDDHNYVTTVINDGHQGHLQSQIKKTFSNVCDVLNESLMHLLKWKNVEIQTQTEAENILNNKINNNNDNDNDDDNDDDNDNDNDDNDSDNDNDDNDIKLADNENNKNFDKYHIYLNQNEKSVNQLRQEYQSKIGYLIMRIANLNGQKLQTLYALNNLRAKYINYYSFECNNSNINNLIKLFGDMVNDRLYYPIIKGLLRQAWINLNEFNISECKNNTIAELVEPTTYKEIKKTIKYIFDTNIIDSKILLFHEISFNDLQAFFDSPLKQLEKEQENEETKMNSQTLTATAAQKVIDDWQQKEDPVLFMLTKAHVFSRCHWTILAKCIAPAEWNNLITGKTVRIQKGILQITQKIVDDNKCCFENYKPTKDQPDVKILKALKTQLMCYFKGIFESNYDQKTKCKPKKQKWKHNKCNAPIIFGFIAWLLAWNHWPYRYRKDNNFNQSPLNIFKLTNNDKLIINITSMNNMISDWLTTACDKTAAEKMLDAKFVYPSNFKNILRQQTISHSKWSLLLNLIHSMPDWTYFAWYNYQLNNRKLATQLRDIVTNDGNWCNSKYWDECNFGSLTIARDKFDILCLPTTHAFAIYACKKYLIRLSSLINPNCSILAIIVPKIIPGFDFLFDDVEGLKFTVEEIDIVNEVCVKLGCLSINSSNNESSFVGIVKNSMQLFGSTLCLIKIGKAMKNSSRLKNFTATKLSKFDTGK